MRVGEIELLHRQWPYAGKSMADRRVAGGRREFRANPSAAGNSHLARVLVHLARAMRKRRPLAGRGFWPLARRAFALQNDQSAPDAAPRGNPGILQLSQGTGVAPVTPQSFRHSISMGDTACRMQAEG